MYNAVIFDLDGTLLDTLLDIQSVLNKALLSKGLETFEAAEVRLMVGHGLSELVKKASPGSSAEVQEELLSHIKTQYAQAPFTYAKPYDGIVQVLQDLKEKGVIIGVLTNKHHPIAKTICDHFFPNLIDGVQGEVQGLARKPDPEGFEVLANTLGIRGLDIVFVGDSETDIATAINAQIPSIGVIWGFRDEIDLIQAGAQMIVKTIDELRFLLGLDS